LLGPRSRGSRRLPDLSPADTFVPGGAGARGGCGAILATEIAPSDGDLFLPIARSGQTAICHPPARNQTNVHFSDEGGTERNTALRSLQAGIIRDACGPEHDILTMRSG
jgi:hypothetical protein